MNNVSFTFVSLFCVVSRFDESQANDPWIKLCQLLSVLDPGASDGNKKLLDGSLFCPIQNV